MIICAQCKHNEISGALFCSQCGADLSLSTGTTAKIKKSEIKKIAGISPVTAPDFPPPPPGNEDINVAIQLVDTQEFVFIKGDKNLTLGRSAEGQIVMPDIDLSPFDAYEAGVSRLHASLEVKGKQITAKDLGSANGTRINGKITTAHEEHTIQNGDILTLGKLKIIILIRE